MTELNTFNQFFTDIGCNFQCYDMSRFIQPIEHQQFIDFEQTKIPWNTPFMQHAWLAILFWSASGAEKNYTVWFIKLPLDEQAKLNLAARDDFLQRLVSALTQQLNHHQANKQSSSGEKIHSLENAMKDNPFGFQPRQEQMANFHAIAHKHLGLPASQYYQPVRKYFSSHDGCEQWQQLAFQGIADMAARLDEKNNLFLLTEAIAQLPPAPLQVLGNCLENHPVPRQLNQAIFNRVIQTLEKEAKATTPASILICTAAIRATAQASDPELQTLLLKKILQSAAGIDIEVLAAISGRCWPQLQHPETLSLFLEALAGISLNCSQSQGAFNAIMTDLMFIPGMRIPVLQAFRSPERSELLAQAIGTFLSKISSAQQVKHV